MSRLWGMQVYLIQKQIVNRSWGNLKESEREIWDAMLLHTESACNTADPGSIPGLEDLLEKG